jgi:hypothetical protein
MLQHLRLLTDGDSAFVASQTAKSLIMKFLTLVSFRYQKPRINT